MKKPASPVAKKPSYRDRESGRMGVKVENERPRDPFGFRFRDNTEGESNSSRGNDPLDRFMFGGPRNHEQNPESESTIGNALGQMDYEEVFKHVDTLITSARELKPLIGKVMPFIDQFMDKNKS
ncbi:hypothetical protein [Mesobacillus subterraneus]|uniref:Uncharacterized protein n=1 Tax=Mesobacillus subterraneus TaxID=285983 RepID=A0A3R9DXB5_9BACI|nr:hypothetical protein [Mesobacillus subterraneus]RSD29389.1 hypothetical protein EJA10_01715 [Mesobacillus subterraneus]